MFGLMPTVKTWSAVTTHASCAIRRIRTGPWYFNCRAGLSGREASAHVRFDADREDLVSRNHARIVRDPADPNRFLLTALGSRNGTFINRQRIYAASRLQHGDRVQLGPSGPEFAFEMDPPPAARPTRLAESA